MLKSILTVFNPIKWCTDKLDIIDPHLDLEVETGRDSRFSVFLGSKSKFTLESIKTSMEKSIF